MKLRDTVRLLLSPAKLRSRRELERVRRQPRYTPGWTTLGGCPLKYADSASYFCMHEEIFAREVYAFDTTNSAPRIIDGGANIGLSAIYFKRRFPSSRISAFEADPEIAAILRKNLDAQGMTDIEVSHAALWTKSGHIAFLSEGADSGRINNDGNQPSQSIKVPSISVGELLSETIDYLKLDVEGAETDILLSSGDNIQNAKRIFIEYHSQAGKQQRLHELLYYLTRNNYRYYIQSPSPFTKNPFQEIRTYAGFDMAVNIHATHIDLRKEIADKVSN
jgi:FkbM family methyltransferase